MATVRLRYIFIDRDRRGNERVYFRKHGLPKIRIREKVDTPEFMLAYQKILSGGEAIAPSTPATNRLATKGTWRHLCTLYFASSDFLRLDPYTQRRRRAYLEATFTEPVRPGSGDVFGDVPIQYLTPQAIAVLRDRKMALPEAANMRLKSIRQVFKWGMTPEQGLVKTNPAASVGYFVNKSSGFHSWTNEEVEAFERQHPIGTKARLAFSLMLYLGVRRSDVVRIGPQHIRGDVISFKVFKGRNRNPTELTLPVLPALAEVISATPCGHLSFLVNQYGRPYSEKGFGATMRRWCDAANLPECSSHGLRKAGATRAAENGATEHQLMAIFGWLTPKQAALYTRAARQKVLAAGGMPFLNRTKADQK